MSDFIESKFRIDYRDFDTLPTQLVKNFDFINSRIRNAIALAFKDGKNPVAEGARAVSYLYHNNELIRTPGFLEWDKNIEKEFEYGHQWCDEDDK